MCHRTLHQHKKCLLLLSKYQIIPILTSLQSIFDIQMEFSKMNIHIFISNLVCRCRFSLQDRSFLNCMSLDYFESLLFVHLLMSG